MTRPTPAPAVVSRHPGAAWWGTAAALAFVLYETTIPFDFRFTAAQAAAGLARGGLDPAGRGRALLGTADIVGNLLLFLPLGFGLAVTPLGRRTGRARPWLLLLLAAACSAGIEALQLFSPRRYTQLTDVACNTAGAAGGLLLARAGGRDACDRAVDWLLRRLRDDPAAVLTVVLTAVILGGALLPLDLSIARASLLRHLRTLDPGPCAPGGPPEGRLAAWTGLAKLAWLFACWGAATGHWLAGRVRRPVAVTLAGGALLALVAEGLQLFVQSRTLGPCDAVAGWLGAAAGLALARGGRRHGLDGRALLRIAVAGYAAYLVFDTLSPLDPPLLRTLLQGGVPDTRPLLFDPVPLRDAFARPRLAVLADWTARFVRFAPLGALLRLGVRRRTIRAAAAVAAVAVVFGLELLEGHLGARRGDMTDVVTAAAGLVTGWLIAARVAPRLRGAPAPGEAA